MPELAYVNGSFLPISEATVSIDDRGFQFGDGVYEVMVTYDGLVFQMNAHMQRLRRSADGISLVYDFDAQPLEPVIRDGLERSGLADAMIYVQLTRGVAPRVHVIPEGVAPTVVMTFKPRPIVEAEIARRGLSVMTAPESRWSKCYIKAITLLPNVLAWTEAKRRGYDDAIFVTDAGEVRECTASNIFIVIGGVLQYPPRTEAVLHGVTQGFLLECATGLDVEVREKAFDVDTLRGANEVFLSGTTVEVLAITSIDGQAVGDGKVGPVTQRLHREFRRRIEAIIATRR